MSCPHVTAFLSCSFKDDDREVNEYFKGLCDSLNILCSNVSEGYSQIPPEVARRQISDSSVVVAVVVKRDELQGGWTMPSSVHEELTMAFTLKKPTLMLIEDEVRRDGFIQNFGTYLPFDRTKLCDINFIRKLVSSLHALRMQSVELNGLLPDQYSLGYYADTFFHMMELTKTSTGAEWRTETTKKLVFTKQYDGPIKNCVWASASPRENQKKIEYTLNISGSSKDFTFNTEVFSDTPEQLEVGLRLSPCPQKDDWVELDFSSQSQFFNFISRDQVTDKTIKRIGDREFHCFDGIIPIQPTRRLHIQFRFPSFYKIDKETIFPFVGSYTGSVDYIVESEIARSKIQHSRYGQSLQYDITIESPLVRHVYGIAWNLLA